MALAISVQYFVNSRARLRVKYKLDPFCGGFGGFWRCLSYLDPFHVYLDPFHVYYAHLHW